MPKSHDGKPRNRDRRNKWQNEQKEMARAAAQKQKPHGFIGPVVPLVARLQLARRLLRQNYQAAVKAQRELEQSLRALGVTWRAVEKALGKLADGKWSVFNEAILKGLVEGAGMKVAA